MGILTSYIENGTKLKSLKFGDSKFTSQPFIQTPLPSDDKVVTKPATPLAAYADGVVRGALISVQRSARDVERLTKYMATPSGVQFALKQNLLSRVAAGTETSGFFNEGIYTPLSTLAQAGVGVLGIHLNKQGLLPTSLKKYGSTIYELNQSDPNQTYTNRLVDLHLTSILESSEFDVNVRTYSGGPGSILGIGKTKIRYATKGDGVTPLRTAFNTRGKYTHSLYETQDSWVYPTELSDTYAKYTGTVFPSVIKDKYPHNWLVNGKSTYSVYDPNSLNPVNGLSDYLVPGKTGNGLSILNNEKGRRSLAELAYHSPINDRLIKAKREIVDHLERPYISGSFDVSPKMVGCTEYSSAVTLDVGPASGIKNADYKHGAHEEGKNYLANLDKNVGYYNDNGKIKFIQHRHSRNIGPDFRKTSRNVRGFGDGDMGAQASYYDKVTQQTEWYEGSKNKVLTVDEIYYASGTKRTSTDFGSEKDLITFRIRVIDPKSGNKEKITFRAYIDNLSDNYSPDWGSQTYMGRGEKFYKYNSFDRKISLGFTVVAEGIYYKDIEDVNGAHHRDKMYDRLNQLASSLAPTYTDQGYMAGNIHQLTVGNYISNQYGIITGMTYEIMDESPWDIEKGKQLPMYIKVTGFQFTPIHDFRPEYKMKDSPKFINQA
jgi:hypothetical protein